jgi:hypothetical protein
MNNFPHYEPQFYSLSIENAGKDRRILLKSICNKQEART